MLKITGLLLLASLLAVTVQAEADDSPTCLPRDDPRICHQDGCLDVFPCITVKCYSPFTMWACQQWICAERLYESCVSYCLGGPDGVCVRR